MNQQQYIINRKSNILELGEKHGLLREKAKNNFDNYFRDLNK